MSGNAPPAFDAIVIGLGAMGASAACQLAARGARVLGLEQFDIPHALGSSHGFSRMTRMAYFEHPDYVMLLRSANRLWHRLESEGGQKLIYLTGGLYLGPAGGELVGGSLAAAKMHGLAHELIELDELRRRFPQFHVPENFVGFLDREAGFILPEKAIATFAGLALRRGAQLHGREPVLDWSADSAGVSVVTPRGTYRAATAIFCGGAWSERLVRGLGIPLRVTRQVMGWVWPKQPAMFELTRLPVWAVDHLDGTIHYGFPMLPDSPGLKLAHHAPAQAADPTTVDRQITDADERTIRPFLQRFIPDADGPLLSMRVCLYTNSPDQHFLIDHHPENRNVVFACGFSGHGFKFAPVIGAALADLALTGKTTHPIKFLGCQRLLGRRPG
jgi:sarcosine oxidase